MASILSRPQCVNKLRLRQNGHHVVDGFLKFIMLYENYCILIKILPKFIPEGLMNNDTSLVQIMAWRWSGAKPLSEPMMVSLLMHIYASLGLNELNWLVPLVIILILIIKILFFWEKSFKNRHKPLFEPLNGLVYRHIDAPIGLSVCMDWSLGEDDSKVRDITIKYLI